MLNEQDRIRVGEAVTRAEASSDGEIVTIVAADSDSYNDVVLHWSMLAMAFMLAIVSAAPGLFLYTLDRAFGGWSAWTVNELLAMLLFGLAATFLVARWIFGMPPLRHALIPAATRARRVRRRAILLFRLTAENRTRAKTGVLLYLSLAECRAEIVADAAIVVRVKPEAWGEAMHALIDAVRKDRAGDGMVAAVGCIGQVLGEHFPRSADDANELPDRLILL